MTHIPTSHIFTHAHTRQKMTLALAISEACNRYKRTQSHTRKRSASLHETPRERDARVYGAMGVRYCTTQANPRNTYAPPQLTPPPDAHMQTVVLFDESAAYAANAQVPVQHTNTPFTTRATIFATPTSTIPATVTLVYDTSAPEPVLRASLATNACTYRVLDIDA